MHGSKLTPRSRPWSARSRPKAKVAPFESGDPDAWLQDKPAKVTFAELHEWQETTRKLRNRITELEEDLLAQSSRGGGGGGDNASAVNSLVVELEMKDATIARLEEQLYAFEDEQRSNFNRPINSGSRGAENDNVSAVGEGGRNGSIEEGRSKEGNNNNNGAMAAVLARLAAAESLALVQAEELEAARQRISELESSNEQAAGGATVANSGGGAGVAAVGFSSSSSLQPSSNKQQLKYEDGEEWGLPLNNNTSRPTRPAAEANTTTATAAESMTGSAFLQRCVRIKLGDPLGRVLKKDGSLAPFGVRNANKTKYSSSNSSTYAAGRSGSVYNQVVENSTGNCCYVDYVRSSSEESAPARAEGTSLPGGLALALGIPFSAMTRPPSSDASDPNRKNSRSSERGLPVQGALFRSYPVGRGQRSVGGRSASSSQVQIIHAVGPDFVKSNAQFPNLSRLNNGEDDSINGDDAVNAGGSSRAKHAKKALTSCYHAILSAFADAHLTAAAASGSETSAGQPTSQSDAPVPHTLRLAPAAASAGQPGGGGLRSSGGGGGNGGVGGLGGHTGVIGGAGASTMRAALPALSLHALGAAFDQLTSPQRDMLWRSCRLLLCLFAEDDPPRYQEAGFVPLDPLTPWVNAEGPWSDAILEQTIATTTTIAATRVPSRRIYAPATNGANNATAAATSPVETTRARTTRNRASPAPPVSSSPVTLESPAGKGSEVSTPSPEVAPAVAAPKNRRPGSAPSSSSSRRWMGSGGNSAFGSLSGSGTSKGGDGGTSKGGGGGGGTAARQRFRNAASAAGKLRRKPPLPTGAPPSKPSSSSSSSSMQAVVKAAMDKQMEEVGKAAAAAPTPIPAAAPVAENKNEDEGEGPDEGAAPQIDVVSKDVVPESRLKQEVNRELVPGAAVEVRYKGRLAWFPGTITNVSKDRRKGERFDITYADGDSEKAVPRIRVRYPGQVEPPLLKAGARVEARYGGGKKAFGAVIVNVWPGNVHYMLEYDDEDKEARVSRELIFAQCVDPEINEVSSPEEPVEATKEARVEVAEEPAVENVAEITHEPEAIEAPLVKPPVPVANNQISSGEVVPGAAVEVRYKGRLAWFPGTITNVSKDRRKGERFDIAYADGDSEKAVPRIRVRYPGQVEPPLLKAGARVEARYGGGKKTFGAVIVNVWPDNVHYMLEYDDENKEARVPREMIFAQCVDPEINEVASSEEVPNAVEEPPSERVAEVTKEPEPELAEVPATVADVLPNEGTLEITVPPADLVPETAITTEEATSPEVVTRAEEEEAAKGGVPDAEMNKDTAATTAPYAASDTQEVGPDIADAAVPSTLPETEPAVVNKEGAASPLEAAIPTSEPPEKEDLVDAEAQAGGDEKDRPNTEPVPEKEAKEAQEEKEKEKEEKEIKEAPIDVGTPVAMTTNGQAAVDEAGVAHKNAWQVGTVTEVVGMDCTVESVVDGRLLRRVVPFQSLRRLGALNADALAASTNSGKGKKGGKNNNNSSTSSVDEYPLAVGKEVVAHFGNRPGGRFYSGKITAARRLTPFEVFYDVDYDDGDREEGVLPDNVRPLARLLTKASRELQVGDEAIVCFRGRQQQRYLATITERHNGGEKYSVRFADGDVEDGVLPANVLAVDQLMQAAAKPPPPLASTAQSQPQAPPSATNDQINSSSSEAAAVAANASNTSNGDSKNTRSGDGETIKGGIGLEARVALKNLSDALNGDSNDSNSTNPPAPSAEAAAAAAVAAIASAPEIADVPTAAGPPLRPLVQGCPVMAAARGRGRWFSGLITRVRTGSTSSSSSSNGGSSGNGALGEWVYDVEYNDGETEKSLCGALLAPCL